MISSKKQTALVLGSGGARGLAHVGVIKALEERNINIDIITGTSIGAMIGGLYASGMSTAEMEKIIHEVDMMMLAKILIPKLFSPGFIDNKRIFDFINDLAGNQKIENLKIPFAAVATDLITGEEVVFNKGYLKDAIIASIAIPTVLQPVYHNNRYLIDGGLCNPLPISVALEMKAQKIIAVNVSPNPKRFTSKMKSKKTEEVKQLLKKLPALFSNLLNDSKTEGKELPELQAENRNEPEYSPSMFNILLQTFSISTNNLMAQHLRMAKPDILITPKLEEYDMLDFYKGKEIVKCGYDAAKKQLNLLPHEIEKKKHRD